MRQPRNDPRSHPRSHPRIGSLGALLAGAALAALPACARELCNVGSGVSPLTLTIADRGGADGRLRPGGYTFTVTTEIGELTWSCAIAAEDPDADACEVSDEVGGEDDTSLLLAGIGGSEDFRLEFFVLKPNVTTGPDELRLVIERDGEVVADERFTPEYELLTGGRCGQSYASDESPAVEL